MFYLCDCGYKAPASECVDLESTEALLAELAKSATKGATNPAGMKASDGATDSKGSED